MIRAPWNASIFCFLPIALKKWIYIIDPFCGLNKSKINFDILHLHLLHVVPVNELLVARYVNSMNRIISGYINSKCGVPDMFSSQLHDPFIYHKTKHHPHRGKGYDQYDFPA